MKLTLQQFLNCDIYYEDLRKYHRATITNNNKLNKVEDVVLYFRGQNMLEFVESVIVRETDTSSVFEEPINLNTHFWNSGNNYFFNCLKYGFRKNVVPYKKANEYISNTRTPNLYSAEYYRSLEPMRDKEIEDFLKKSPIGMHNRAIAHGIHRVSAMIGRLVRGKKYIPFYIGRGY